MNPSNDDTVRIYNAANEQEAHMLRMELEAEGIDAVVEGGTLQFARGEVPMSPETLPSVLVLDSDVAAAQSVVRQFVEAKYADAPGSDWTCSACGETVDGQFGLCWKCQAERPETNV